MVANQKRLADHRERRTTNKTMIKITKIASKFKLICPCCREPVLIQIEKYDDGKKIVSLIHKDENIELFDLSEFGLEFGIREGGGEDG